ncbi:MAG: T9SS type A sorting domain-containing protein, partial [Ignavibacteriaceae bacterium]|nr:T9SS type A sorting domain-containing protein [Ignavibacteriaceae bacterium]
MFKIIILCIAISEFISAQQWDYNFGNSTGSITSGTSYTFLPDPQTGGGTDTRISIANRGGSFNLENQTISFGDGVYLRGVASTSNGNNRINKYSLFDYSGGNTFTIRFLVRLGNSSGGSIGASSGSWVFAIGNGTFYNDNNSLNSPQVFAGLQFQFGASGSIIASYRRGGSWITFPNGTFVQGTDYIIDIYGNNSSAALNYNYLTSQTVASYTYDVWVNGVLVGNDLPKGQLANGNTIDSYCFYGERSISNVANIFLDDIKYTNQISMDPLPVELNSFTASVIGSKVELKWQTETEVNNYGFEIQKSESGNRDSQEWQTIDFIEGFGNSNSPKDYSFTDDLTLDNNRNLTLFYRLKQIDNDGTFTYSEEIKVELLLLNGFDLEQNYPNPFNPSTVIRYAIPQSGNVKLSVYNILGQEVKVLTEGYKEAGSYEVTFDGEGLGSGLYIYKL